MGNKVFKTLDEQVEILKAKNMIIKNPAYAKEILLRENYFFLAGYRHLFLKSEVDRVYIDGTTFEELYALFLFDRRLRNILFRNILIVENNIKSIIAYQLSKKYGYNEKEYLNPKNFNTMPEKKSQVQTLLEKMKRQIKFNVSTHSATMHYAQNYNYIPLWILVKVLSFGIVSELFSILKKEDQYDIVDLYKIEPEDFNMYLSVLSNYRNLCAHEDILYDNKSQKVINDCMYHRMLNIPIMDNEYIYGKNDLFAVIIILKSLLKDDEVEELVDDIKLLIDKLDKQLTTISISKVLDQMGFPKNWESIKNIRKKELFDEKE